MPDTSYEFLASFFRDDLPFTPTAGQIALFQSDLSLVSPYLMRASLKEVKAGTLGYVLVYRPDEWRAAIFTVYNRKIAEHAQLFPIFHCFETALRSTVAVALEQHYRHPRWWTNIYEELRKGNTVRSVTKIAGIPISKDAAHLVGQIIMTIDGRNLSGNRISNIQNGYQFVELCDLGHIGQLIDQHWSVFAPKFVKSSIKITRADFKAKFNRVRDARNDIYHHKSLARMSNVIATAEELLDFLDCSLGFVFKKLTGSTLTPPSFSISIERRHHTW